MTKAQRIYLAALGATALILAGGATVSASDGTPTGNAEEGFEAWMIVAHPEIELDTFSNGHNPMCQTRNDFAICRGINWQAEYSSDSTEQDKVIATSPAPYTEWTEITEDQEEAVIAQHWSGHGCIDGSRPLYAGDNILVFPMAECDSGSGVNNAFHAINDFLGNPQYMGVRCAFDADMKALVQEYQTMVGLPVTGEVDAVTWDSLQIPSYSPVSGPDVNNNGITEAAEFDGHSSGSCDWYTPDGCNLSADANSSYLSCTEGGHTVLTSSCSVSPSGRITCHSS